MTPLTNRIRIRGPWIAALLISAGIAGCDKPCDRLMERLDTCTRKSPARVLHDAPGVKDEIRTRCRRAEPRHVKRCLALRDCRRVLECASRAVKPPKHHF